MKKVTLYALSILSLAMLAACQPAAPETHQRKPLVSSSKKSSKSSRSSYAKKSSSKKDFSSGFDDDHSHSSSDSNTREDPNYTMSLMDQGESLEAIGDIPEMPKWAAFK
jgi:lipoprotein